MPMACSPGADNIVSDESPMESDSKQRLIALDLDGTVLAPDGAPSSRTCEAIQAVMARGWRVCVATGRNYTESRQIVRQLGVRDESVFVGGATVVHVATDQTLRRTTMHRDLACEVAGFFEHLGHPALALQDTDQAGIDYLVTQSIALWPASARWMKMMAMQVRYVPTLADHDHQHTLRVGICCSPMHAQDIMPKLEKHFGHRTTLHNIGVPGMGCQVLEVFDPAVSKWEGIQFIASRHGIRPDQIVAVGDDLNDLHMIRSSGLGVAMGNAHPDVKRAANRVIGSNAEDGLADFLHELMGQSLEVASS